MSTTTVGLMLNLAERKILDESNDEYSEQNLLDLYHLAIKEIINLVPSAHTERLTWKLAPGSRQVIPASGVNIVDIIMDMGTDGATPGPAIRETTLDVMKALIPGWEADTATAAGENWFRMPEDKRSFSIYPKSTGANYILGQITTVPDTVIWDANGDFKLALIPIDDTYAHAIVNGMVYIAYDDDSDIPGNTPRSQMFYARFLNDLGLREQKKGQYKRTGGN